MRYQTFNERMIKKLENVISIYTERVFVPIQTFTEVSAFETKEHYRKPPETEYRRILTGESWGGEYQNIWLKCRFEVQKADAGGALYLCQKTGARESLVFVNDKTVGMFNEYKNFASGRHDNILLTDCAKEGEIFDIAMECYAWHHEPGLSCYDNLGKDVAPDSDFIRTFDHISICTKNEELYEFICNLRIAIAVSRYEKQEFLQARAIALLEQAFPYVCLFPETCDWNAVMQGLQKANSILSELFEGKGSAINGHAFITGHSHLDTAWLWPMKETIRKNARTISNAVHLMKQFPDYRFVQPAVLHTHWLEEYYPELFEEVKSMIAEGRYEPNGAVWVECDCNMTGGEYMIRQFVKGQSYLKEKFDYHADSFWLPDTFGYSASIPQIMQGCGVKYFYTTKLSWNEHNKFPYETFVWKGIDNSEVITHFNTTPGDTSFAIITEEVNKLQNKQADDSRLIAFGQGDGGGGPTEYNITEIEKLQKIDGLPEITYMSISDYGKLLEKKKERLPVYHGELYLELHRGTLTQMHNIKRNNRKAEVAIHNMEALCVMSGANFDEKKYDEWVKVLLQNQFHDILPGTCLQCVHQTSLEETTNLIQETKTEMSRCAETMVVGAKGVTLFNTLSFERNDTQHLEGVSGYLRGVRNQWVEDVMGRRQLAVSGIGLEGLSAKSFAYTEDEVHGVSPFRYDGVHLETPYASICFEENGYIASFVDKASGRELRRAGAQPLGTFYMGEDIAVFWDNWDVEYDQKFKMKVQKGFIERKVVADGEVEMRLRSTFKIGNYSELVQDMIVYADSPRVDFQTKVEWKDKHQLLKVGFDVDILATSARHEMQFGYIERPTTENDCVETAKFEVCNHKWTDVSESRFGVAVLNDCKYGISVRNSDIRLSLHRGGCRPDPSGDFGIHEFTYSILPHNCSFDVPSVVKPAYELNVPAVVTEGMLKREEAALIAISAENIICETVKPAETKKDAFVLRLYEAEKTKTVTKIRIPEGMKVYETNMLEEITEELQQENGYITMTFRPFEIKTVLCDRT